MRDEMQVGDLAFFYHSNAKPSGVTGICEITKTGVADYTSWDPQSQYYDPKSSSEYPRWIMVQVKFVEKFSSCIPISVLRNTAECKGLKLLDKGSRLSILPVSKAHFRFIHQLDKR